MSLWLVLPILLPLVTGAALLLAGRRHPGFARASSGASLLALLATIAVIARPVADGEVLACLLGNWQAPFGIALAADRLAVLMLAVTAVLGVGAYLAALGGGDRDGPHFHALLHFQLMGLNGAFLTADLFNLFVFFEVLLAASYALLLHGRGGERLRPGLHYVVVNLAASALFLAGAAVLYGVTGTLNLADLALRVRGLAPADVALVRSGAGLLLVVFAVKSAMLPLHLWLPQAYRVATIPVAALFVVMTKVGVYAIARVFPLVFEVPGAATVDVATPWLQAGGLATLAIGALGALGARDLRGLAAWLVLVSAGTLLAALAPFSAAALGSALFYLAPSAVAGAALFVVAGLVATQRGAAGDGFEPGRGAPARTLTGALYATVALAVAGLPPFAGFLAKIEILAGSPGRTLLWAVLLGASLAVVIALARAGSALFWNIEAVGPAIAVTGSGGAAAAVPAPVAARPPALGTVLAIAWLAACSIVMVPAAGTLQAYTRDAAVQLVAPRGYVEAVRGARPVLRTPGKPAPAPSPAWPASPGSPSPAEARR